MPSNERLEFLGDSIHVSFGLPERLCVISNFSRRLPHGSKITPSQTTTLAQDPKDLGYDKLLKLSRGEEDSGGRQNIGLLANTF